MKRIKTPTVQIGKVLLGSDQPVRIQSMTNTDTADPKATAAQIIELAEAGSELVRLTVNTDQAAEAIPEVRRILDQEGYSDLPLIGDFHYNGHILLERHPACAKILDKYRINPGNVGFGDKHQYNFTKIIEIAIANDKPVRIGVNWGSLDQDLFTKMMDENAKLNLDQPESNPGQQNPNLMEKPTRVPKSDREVLIDAMVESAWRSAQLAEKIGLPQNKIVLSVKMSELPDMLAAYQNLAALMRTKKHFYALHLGLTEAGSDLQGIVSSSAALAILLNQGIGDTIRVSITPNAATPRTREVEVCRQLLQSLDLRHFKPKVTSCPGCGRTGSTFFQDLASRLSNYIDQNMPSWRDKYPGVEKLNIAVMGCVVNGPGEAKHADIAISLPGKMEKPVAPVYIKGEFFRSLEGDDIFEQFVEILEGELKGLAKN